MTARMWKGSPGRDPFVPVSSWISRIHELIGWFMRHLTSPADYLICKLMLFPYSPIKWSFHNMPSWLVGNPLIYIQSAYIYVINWTILYWMFWMNDYINETNAHWLPMSAPRSIKALSVCTGIGAKNPQAWSALWWQWTEHRLLFLKHRYLLLPHLPLHFQETMTRSEVEAWRAAL